MTFSQKIYLFVQGLIAVPVFILVAIIYILFLPFGLILGKINQILDNQIIGKE